MYKRQTHDNANKRYKILESHDSKDTLQAKQLSHDSRNRPKAEFIAYIYILLYIFKIQKSIYNLEKSSFIFNMHRNKGFVGVFQCYNFHTF